MVIKFHASGNNHHLFPQKLAEEIKAKLECARKAKASIPKEELPDERRQARDGKEGEDNTVVLTRYDKSGQAWPVEEQDGATMMSSSGGKRKRKKLKLNTHEQPHTPHIAGDRASRCQGASRLPGRVSFATRQRTGVLRKQRWEANPCVWDYDAVRGAKLLIERDGGYFSMLMASGPRPWTTQEPTGSGN